MKLSDYSVESVQDNAKPLSKLEADKLLSQLSDWQIVDVDNIRQLQGCFVFSNYVDTVKFANLIAELAEQVDHHPCLVIEWGKLSVSWWTHRVQGLHFNDFVMAAKTQQLYENL